MTLRLGWAWDDNAPTALWEMWDEFGIGQSEMIGYWVNGCPVKAEHPNVHATVYHKQGRSMIAVANWDDETVDCHLKIVFFVLGINQKRAHLHAMEIKGFQPKCTFYPDEVIPIAPGKAWVLILEEEKVTIPA